MSSRHPERDPEYLRYALRCAARIGQLIADEKLILFEDADMLEALYWNMYQLAAVTGKPSDAVKASHPEIPWRAIAGLRNFYAHACSMRTHMKGSTPNGCGLTCVAAMSPISR